MLPYCAAALILMASGIYLCELKKGRAFRLLFLLLAGAALTLLAGLRYAIGFDYSSYRDIYSAVASLTWPEVFSYRPNEFLFILINKLFSAIGCSYIVFLFILAALTHAAALWFIGRHSSLPWLSVFLYIVLQFLAHSMNLVRQSLGASFFLLAFPFLLKKKWLPYLLLMMAGGLIHNSVFFMIPLYFLLNRKNTPAYMTACTLVLLAAYFLSDDLLQMMGGFLPPQYADYRNSIYWQGNSWRYVLFPALYFGFALVFRRRMLKKAPQNCVYINSALFSFLLSVLVTKHFILERFSIYPFLLSLVLLPNMAALFRDVGAKKYRAALGAILLFGIAYFCFAAREGFHNVYPYVSLFQRARGR